MADIDNVKLGPCSIKFNDEDLGHSIGGCTVSYEPEYHDIKVDKYGNTVAEKVLIGESLKATVPLAESTLANFEIAVPASTEVGAGRATIGKEAGERMAQYAKELVLHPSQNDAADLSEDVVLHKALVSEPVEIRMGTDGEKIFEVVFHAILDEGKSDGNYLGFFGDSEAA